MDHLNSANETDQLFAETDTLYDFFEQEELWESLHQTSDHPIKRFINKITDEDHQIHWPNRHN